MAFDRESFDLDVVRDDRDHRRALPRQADAADGVLEQLAQFRRRRRRRDRRRHVHGLGRFLGAPATAAV